MRIKKNKTTWKTLETAYVKPRGLVDAELHAYLKEYLAEMERPLAGSNRRGFCTVGLDGQKARMEQFITNEDGTVLRDEVRIIER